jgi:hypothetical protein
MRDFVFVHRCARFSSELSLAIAVFAVWPVSAAGCSRKEPQPCRKCGRVHGGAEREPADHEFRRVRAEQRTVA